MSPPADVDALDQAELKNLVLELLAERAEFQGTIRALRDEVARLKAGWIGVDDTGARHKGRQGVDFRREVTQDFH